MSDTAFSMSAIVCFQIALSLKPLASVRLLLPLSNALRFLIDNSFSHFPLNLQSFNFSAYIFHKRRIPNTEILSLCPMYSSEASDVSIEFQV